jgi:quercetin dioxygenase-like cupin family protein
MKYTKIYSDENGESHFKDIDIELESIEYAPPAPALLLSKLMPAKQYAFTTFKAGWYGDWHTTPLKQIYFILSGTLQGTVSDGEKRLFGPGSIVLVEDTAGKGHRTKVIGSEDVTAALIQLSTP